MIKKIKKIMKKGLYRYSAKGVAFLHLLFILIYIASIILIFASKQYRMYAATLLTSTKLLEKTFKGCILTHLENKLLRKSGKKVYYSSFIKKVIKKHFSRNIPQQLLGKITSFFSILSLLLIIFAIAF